MAAQVVSRDVIRAQARRAAESDFKAGRDNPDCPYMLGTSFAKRWYAAYLEREVELDQERESKTAQVISTFSAGPVEQLEVMP